MFDIRNADTVEITIAADGRMWVNVDGKCEFRVQQTRYIVVDDPIENRVLFLKEPA